MNSKKLGYLKKTKYCWKLNKNVNVSLKNVSLIFLLMKFKKNWIVIKLIFYKKNHLNFLSIGK